MKIRCLFEKENTEEILREIKEESFWRLEDDINNLNRELKYLNSVLDRSVLHPTSDVFINRSQDIATQRRRLQKTPINFILRSLKLNSEYFFVLKST